MVIFGLQHRLRDLQGAKLGGASSSASALQVNSQKLAVQGREAVAGDKEAYAAFKATKAQMDGDIKQLNDRFGSETRRSATKSSTVTNTWDLVGKNADQVIASEAAVTGLASNADSFAGKVPQLQARLDELVRAMSSSGSPASQVYLALRQNVLAGQMDKNITSMRAGGAGASIAGDQLARTAAVFGNVVTGLRKGDAALGVTPLSNGGALAALGQAEIAVDRHEEGPGRDYRRFQEPVQCARRGVDDHQRIQHPAGPERSAVPRADRVRFAQGHQHASATSGCRSCPVSPRSSPSPACCSR